MLVVLPLSTLTAQGQPDVPGILKKVSETYKAASQYEFVTDITMIDPQTKKGITGHTRFAFKPPNKYRMETDGFGEDMMGPLGQGLVVHDGSNLWVYMPKANQYSSIPGDKLTADAPGDLGDGRPEFMDHSMMWRYRGAQDFANGAKLIRQETIDFGGKKLDCYVLQVVPTSGEFRNKEPYTWWVDKSGYRILREDSPGSSDMFKVIRLNEPLSDDLFKFTPPPSAHRFEMTIP